MLDTFLTVAYDHELRQSESVKLANVLSTLPEEDLRKLASGEVKLSFAECSPDEEGRTWLEKYKGTPLFDQALALEKAELELEVAQTAPHEQSDAIYRARDQIRLQKKMLDLDLVAAQRDGSVAPTKGPEQPMAVVPNDEAQGAGAPGDAGPDAEPQKLSFAKAGKGLALARQGVHLSDLMDKLGSNMLNAALSIAKANPKLVGAGIGAGVGALAGGKDNRLGGALVGAGLGAGAGAAAKGIGMRMSGPRGKSFTDATASYVKSLADRARGAIGKAENPTQYSVMPKPPLPENAPLRAHAMRALDRLDAARGRVLPGKNNVQRMKAAARFYNAARALEV